MLLSITPREILIEGLRSLAVSTILVHNHPSGDPSPSESDLLLTRRVKEAGDVIGSPFWTILLLEINVI